MDRELFSTLARQLLPKVYYTLGPIPCSYQHVVSATDVFNALRNASDPPISEADCGQILEDLDKEIR